MRLWAIIRKGAKEQYRSFWILLLTLSMGPFFVSIYYLIIESSAPKYDILIVTGNGGDSAQHDNDNIWNAEAFLRFADESLSDTLPIPMSVKGVETREEALLLLRQGKADAALVLEVEGDATMGLFPWTQFKPIHVEFIGDNTSPYYLVSAVWIQAILGEYMVHLTKMDSPITYSETSLGDSGSVSDFEIAVPGLLILSIIMLMFTASIAFVIEVENRTLIRLRLSNLSPIKYLMGISLVQTVIGIIGLSMTLGTAMAFGYAVTTSLGNMFLIACLTSISIIAFSLLLASFTKSANEILVVGNFPLFLFMFFTGAAFPINSRPMFSILGYEIGPEGLMSPVHAISALKKLLIMDLNLGDVLPEILILTLLTMIYLFLGIFFFWRRHMRMKA